MCHYGTSMWRDAHRDRRCRHHSPHCTASGHLQLHFQYAPLRSLFSPQALCCCVWLVPMRLYEGMVNTVCLVRATRSIAANVVIAIFLSQELVSTPPSCRAIFILLALFYTDTEYSSYGHTCKIRLKVTNWASLNRASLHELKAF